MRQTQKKSYEQKLQKATRQRLRRLGNSTTGRHKQTASYTPESEEMMDFRLLESMLCNTIML